MRSGKKEENVARTAHWAACAPELADAIDDGPPLAVNGTDPALVNTIPDESSVEIEHLDDTRPVAPLKMSQVLRAVGDVSSLPDVAMRVIEVVNSPQSSANDLLHVVESDPALSTRVLKVVNSAACGLRAPVTNLHHALCLLGQKQVRNLAVTLSVSEIFRGGGQIGHYNRARLWKHLVSTAIVGRFVASRCSIPDFEEAFLAGLLHDLGIVLEDQFCHPNFTHAMLAIDGREELCVVEHRIIGFDHASFGCAVAKQWRFPELVVDAMRHHHDFAAYRGAHRGVIAAVVVAHCIATLRGCSSVGRSLLRPPVDAMKELEIDPPALRVLAEDAGKEIVRQQSLFELEKRAA